MQGSIITELDAFTGTPSTTDFLAIDNGSATYKLQGSAFVNATAPKLELDTQAEQGDDADLYNAITALGWSDCIE